MAITECLRSKQKRPIRGSELRTEKCIAKHNHAEISLLLLYKLITTNKKVIVFLTFVYCCSGEWLHAL